MEFKQLERLYQSWTYGVPAARLVRDNKLTISRVHLIKLFNYYELYRQSAYNRVQTDVLANSLFPPWWIVNGSVIQSNPPNWSYEGVFPYGEWQQEIIKEKFNV